MKYKTTIFINVLLSLLVALLGVTQAIAADNKHSGDQILEVEMFEWKLLLNTKKLASGDIVFNAHNRGKEIHELAVIKLNDEKMDASQLPVNRHGAIDESNIKFGKIVGEIENVQVGKTISKVFSLKPGRYAVICNMLEKEPDGSMEAHYASGMHALLEVE